MTLKQLLFIPLFPYLNNEDAKAAGLLEGLNKKTYENTRVPQQSLNKLAATTTHIVIMMKSSNEI